jgi:response regulator RpfG family c-di-GMP phosphodiesterase
MDGLNDTYNVLYVDDEENNLNTFKAALRRNYNVYTALSGIDGIEILENNDIHVVVTDQRMPKMTGTQFLQRIPHDQENVRIILTGFSDMESIIEGINKGEIYRYLTKPWNRDELKITIGNAIETVMLRRKNKHLIRELQVYNEHLEEKVAARTHEVQNQAKEIRVQSEEIHSSVKEIEEINNNLELLVKARTSDLEKKSKAAEESAFIIAHELRAPVASVLGLINLIMNSELNEDVRTIVTHLEASAENLNTVVRNITQAIERGDR